VRFTAGGISIALPSSFKGGAPASAALKAQLKSVVGGKTYVTDMKKRAADMGADWLLSMMGKASKTRWIPEVVIYRFEYSFTLADFTDEFMYPAPDGGTVKQISKTDAQEVWLLTRPKNGTNPAGSRLFAFVEAGDYVYWVEYSGTTVVFNQFQSTYNQSAARLRVTAPASAGGSTDENTTTTAGTTT
jgi:hypothetical protein